MLLEVRNLTIEVQQRHQKLTLCHQLNFAINQGEVLGILGESGSGKSITALSILKLLPPALQFHSGEIIFQNKSGNSLDLLKVSEKKMEKVRGNDIAMVFQEPMTSLNPVFTCGEQIIEAIIKHQYTGSQFPYFNKQRSIFYKEAKDQVISLFKKVKLPDPSRIFNSYPYQLSGGQNQRVMIAMAISCNPALLIADEPTTALDVTVQRSILELLKELQQDTHMSILFITHDISILAEIAQRVLVFNQGNIVEQGDVSKILNHAEHPYTIGLMDCRTAVRKKGERLKTLSFSKSQKLDEPQPAKNTLPQKDYTNNTKELVIENLNVIFTRATGLFGIKVAKHILHNVSLDVFKGETLGLVGESGSGKTTLGRTIMKLIEPESGKIIFHGKPVHQLKGKQLKAYRKNVQIIFQDPYSSLNPRMTIGDIISEPLYVHSLFPDTVSRKKRVYELLKQVNLKEEHYYRYPHQFSGGQRQRIGIARALAVEPEIIILDESVSALDVSIQAQILNLLNDLKRMYNLTYIFISHDLNTVRYMADRLVVLKDGNIVEMGDAEAIITSPQHPYTINLVASIPGNTPTPDKF